MRAQQRVFLALDIGASSGRAVVGRLQRGILRVDQINRFANGPVAVNGTLYWDILALWSHVIESLRIAADKGHTKLDGIGIDTWGVDFGLLGADGQLLGNPVHYRDARTADIQKDILSRIDEQTLYRLTGWPVFPISTFCQLVAYLKAGGKRTLEATDTLLMIPDLFRYFLSGTKGCDLTIAGSSQLLSVRTERWCQRLLKTFKIPRRIMPPLVHPGTVAGPLLAGVGAETGIRSAPVMVVAGHDTPSAAAAVPCVDSNAAFLSCGTWAVVGVVSGKPIEHEDAIRLGFANEVGFASNLFVKNTVGLYLFELLHRALSTKGRKVTYAQMVKGAAAARPFSCLLNTNAPEFFAAQDVPTAARTFLKATGQKTTLATPALTRALLESLAFNCRQVLDNLERTTARKITRLFAVGGGVRNLLLCQFIANATGRDVTAGPAEATVAGNLGIQALAAGLLQTPADIRAMVAASFRLVRYAPRDSDVWEKHYRRYQNIVDSPTA